MEIVVIGSANTDMIIRAPRIPGPGETILGGSFSTAAGGKGANQAVAAARAGGDVTFITRLGNDDLGRQSLEGYRSDHINVEHISTDKKALSGVAMIVVDERGENCITVASGANMNLSPELIDAARDVIESADVLLMQLESPLDSVVKAAGIASAAEVKVILNPAPGQALPDKLLSQVSLITPNETEAELLTGIAVTDSASATLASQALLNRGVGAVIITLGKGGAFIATNEYTRLVPGYEVKAIDTTAAGDVFNGALAVALANGQPLLKASKFANAAAALSVTKRGAQPSIPTLQEINRLMKR